MNDSDSERCRAARIAADEARRWAARRQTWITAALTKMLILQGNANNDVARTLRLSRREVKRHARTPLLPYAIAKGQPLTHLTAVQSAVDDVVHHESGFTADELWDWARIYDGEHGRLAHTQCDAGDTVERALADVELYGKRLRDTTLDDVTRATVSRKLRLAEARARTFGAAGNTIELAHRH